MQKQRQSNIELLRIIAITMVLMLHFNLHGFTPDVLSGSIPFSWCSLRGNLIESFCICAVNVFVLISGYFSIKLSVRSVLNLYIRCFIIGLITYVAYILISGESISLYAIAGRSMAFTHNHWWFVVSYLGLMAISPILNAGCETLDKRTYQYVLLLFSAAMIYLGWWKYLEITNGGYSLIHFIYLYVIARYVKLHVRETMIFHYRWLWILLFICICMIIATLQFVTTRSMYSYDNPLVILAALTLLLFFITIPFKNQFINRVAASVFAAYLIQESPYLGKMWLYPLAADVIANGSCGGGAMLFVVFTVATLVSSVIIDQIFVMPVITLINSYLFRISCKK